MLSRIKAAVLDLRLLEAMVLRTFSFHSIGDSCSDSPLPDQRLSISSLPNGPNGVAFTGLSSKTGTAPNNWALLANGGGPVPSAANLGKAPPGRDPKSRARSRDYLKQYV